MRREYGPAKRKLSQLPCAFYAYSTLIRAVQLLDIEPNQADSGSFSLGDFYHRYGAKETLTRISKRVKVRHCKSNSSGEWQLVTRTSSLALDDHEKLFVSSSFRRFLLPRKAHNELMLNACICYWLATVQKRGWRKLKNGIYDLMLLDPRSSFVHYVLFDFDGRRCRIIVKGTKTKVSPKTRRRKRVGASPVVAETMHDVEVKTKPAIVRENRLTADDRKTLAEALLPSSIELGSGLNLNK